jgi:hypothetical protein
VSRPSSIRQLEEETVKRFLGGRKAALIGGLIALLGSSITPGALAAGGIPPGPQPFCLPNGDCGYLILATNSVGFVDRGDVFTWTCAAVLPSTSSSFIAMRITECKVVDRSTGSEHHAARSGFAIGGAAVYGVGATTSAGSGATYEVCASGLALYLSDQYSFGGCSDDF